MIEIIAAIMFVIENLENGILQNQNKPARRFSILPGA